MKTRNEKILKNALLYKLYMVDGIYFVEDRTKTAGVPCWGYNTIEGALEYIMYNDLETEFDAEIA